MHNSQLAEFAGSRDRFVVEFELFSPKARPLKSQVWHFVSKNQTKQNLDPTRMNSFVQVQENVILSYILSKLYYICFTVSGGMFEIYSYFRPCLVL